MSMPQMIKKEKHLKNLHENVTRKKKEITYIREKYTISTPNYC